MTWECVECCNEFDRAKKPVRCPECGSGKVIPQERECCGPGGHMVNCDCSDPRGHRVMTARADRRLS